MSGGSPARWPLALLALAAVGAAAGAENGTCAPAAAGSARAAGRPPLVSGDLVYATAEVLRGAAVAARGALEAEGLVEAAREASGRAAEAARALAAHERVQALGAVLREAGAALAAHERVQALGAVLREAGAALAAHERVRALAAQERVQAALGAVEALRAQLREGGAAREQAREAWQVYSAYLHDGASDFAEASLRAAERRVPELEGLVGDGPLSFALLLLWAAAVAGVLAAAAAGLARLARRCLRLAAGAAAVVLRPGLWVLALPLRLCGRRGGRSLAKGPSPGQPSERTKQDWEVAFDKAFGLAVEAGMTVVRPDPCGPSEAKAFADERQHEAQGHAQACRDRLEDLKADPEERDIAALLKGLQDAMTATTAVERAAEQEAEAEATSIDGELSRLLGRARCEAAEEARKRVAREVEARLATFQAAQSRRQAARAALAGKATSSTTAEAEESLEQTMQCREKLARAWEEAGRACGEAVKPTEEEMEGGEGWMSWLFTWPFALLVVFWLHVAPLALAFPISSLAFGSSFVWRGLAFYMLARVILHGFLWLEGAIIEQRKWVTENRKWAKTTWKANKKWLVRASMFTSMLIAASVIFAP